MQCTHCYSWNFLLQSHSRTGSKKTTSLHFSSSTVYLINWVNREQLHLQKRNLHDWIQWWASRRSHVLGVVLEEVNHHLTKCLQLSICSCWEQVPKKHNPSENWGKNDSHESLLCMWVFSCFSGSGFCFKFRLKTQHTIWLKKRNKGFSCRISFSRCCEIVFKSCHPTPKLTKPQEFSKCIHLPALLLFSLNNAWFSMWTFFTAVAVGNFSKILTTN